MVQGPPDVGLGGVEAPVDRVQIAPDVQAAAEGRLRPDGLGDLDRLTHPLERRREVLGPL